jgi:hypothetical protein
VATRSSPSTRRQAWPCLGVDGIPRQRSPWLNYNDLGAVSADFVTTVMLRAARVADQADEAERE